MPNISVPGRSGRRVPSLDGVRGLAVLAVFLFHYGGGTSSRHRWLHLLGQTIHLGWAGVSLFFVLSGFLITGILWDSHGKPGWWKRFYKRRTVRIFPLYYLALSLAVIAALGWGYGRQSLAHVWVYLLYLENVPSLPREAAFSPVLPVYHLWSLAVEEQFYLVWPFLIAWMPTRRQAKRLCVLTIVLSFVYRLAALHSGLAPGWGDEFLMARMGELAAGGWLALALRGSVEEIARVVSSARWILPATAASLLMLIAVRTTPALDDPWMETAGLLLLPALCGSLIVQAIAGGVIERIFRAGWLRWLGTISYGIYVYHILLRPVFVWMARQVGLSGQKSQILTAAFAAAGTLLVAALSFNTFESYFLGPHRHEGSPRVAESSEVA